MKEFGIETTFGGYSIDLKSVVAVGPMEAIDDPVGVKFLFKIFFSGQVIEINQVHDFELLVNTHTGVRIKKQEIEAGKIHLSDIHEFVYMHKVRREIIHQVNISKQ